MILYHLKILIRSLRAGTFNTIIKIMGLAVAFVSLYLIFEFVKHEASYDKNFKQSECIFRVVRNWQESESFGASTSGPLLEALKNKFPEINTGTRLDISSDNIVINGKQEFHEDLILLVDSTFFKTFNLRLIKGDPNKALKGPGNLVISKTACKKYFGNQDPIGKKLNFEGSDFDATNKTFIITGIFEDFPKTCHIKTDLLLSLHSFSYVVNQTNPTNHFLITYLRLKNPEDQFAFEKKFPEFMRNFYGESYFNYARSTYRLQPLRNIHGDIKVDYMGYETPKGNMSNLYIFPILGVLILLIASINYVNLSVAEGKYKSITFGINKLTGAGKYFFFKKYLIESVFYSFIASILAVTLIFLLFDSFSELVNRPLELYLTSSPWMIFTVFLLAIFCGIIISLFPSSFYTSKSTINFLKGNQKIIKSGFHLTALPQIIQFSICIILFAGSIFIFKQLTFINNKTRASLDNENVLIIKNPRLLGNQKDAFKQELKKIPGIKEVSLCNDVPEYDGFSHYGFPVDPADINVHLAQFRGDRDYLKTLGLKLKKGRFFDENYNDNNSIVLNETAVKTLGWKEPIGKRYNLGGVRTVIGVIEDIHFEPLQYTIIPQGILLTQPDNASNILVKLNKDNVVKIYYAIQNLWSTFVPDREMQNSFLKEEVDFWYKTERKTGILTVILSVIAIFLSCLGLLGMVLHSIQRKIKEIGVRKVNGATIREIMGLLNIDYIKWILISFTISTPVIYYLMNKWLQNFAYKTELSWWVFGVAGALAVAVAVLTVSWQSWRAATRNPVEALRYE